MKQMTPVQRAWIQLLESMLITATIAGLLSIAPLLSGDGAINWKAIVATFGLAAIFSVAHCLVAYFKPIDPGLSAAIEAVADQLEQRYETKHIPDPPQGTVMSPPTIRATQPVALGTLYNPASYSAPPTTFAWMPTAADLTSQITAPHPSIQPAQQQPAQPANGQGVQQ